MRTFRVDYVSAEDYDHGHTKSHVYTSEKKAHEAASFASRGYAEGHVRLHTIHNNGIAKTVAYDGGRPILTKKY